MAIVAKPRPDHSTLVFYRKSIHLLRRNKTLATSRVIPIIQICCIAAKRTITTASRQRGVREQLSTNHLILKILEYHYVDR